MPDDVDDVKDEITEQESMIPEESDEAMDSFLEDDETESDTEKEESEKTDKQVDEQVDDSEQEKAENDKEETGKPKEDKPVYSDEIDQRIKAIDENPPEPEPEKPSVTYTKQEEQKPEPERKPETSTSDFFDDLSNLSEIKLPDKDITVGDLTINLKEYQSDYPEDYAAIMAISNTIANKIIEKRLEPLKKIDDLNNIVHQVVAKQSDAEFWGAITDKHSDAKTINQSKDFLDWLDKQDPPIQRIAKNMESPDDGIMILDYYKKSQEKAKIDKANKEAKDKKKKNDDLHKGTMRSKANVKITDEVNMDDARAAFDEDD